MGNVDHYQGGDSMKTKPTRPNGNTRKRLEGLYRAHPNWTLERFARRLGMSTTAIYYHLTAIKASGIVVVTENQPVHRTKRRMVADPYGQIIYSRSQP